MRQSSKQIRIMFGPLVRCTPELQPHALKVLPSQSYIQDLTTAASDLAGRDRDSEKEERQSLV